MCQCEDGLKMKEEKAENMGSMAWVVALCVLSVAVNVFLAWKVWELRHAADELRTLFAERLMAETNVGMDLSTSDSKMRQLAVDMDRQLKLLREEQLRYERGDQELKRAVTNISHDLRTPLTAICGYLELLQEEEMSAPAREYLAILGNRTAAIRELTEELFRYSVVRTPGDQGEHLLQEVLSLNAVLEEVMADYYGAFVQAKITPKVWLPEDTICRRGNRQALSRILSNIISNAIKYSDGDFEVKLAEDAKMCFSNTAAALDEVSVGNLFERYFTVESGEHATGLGLAIARTLTEEMGGQIDAYYEKGKLAITLDLSKLPLR